MGSRLRALIEDWLPWYHPGVEKLRDRRTEAIRQRSIKARIRSERVIDEYERADAVAHVQHKLLVDEARRDDDQ